MRKATKRSAPTAVQHGEFWPHENKALPDHLDPRPQIEVKAGDVVMTCAGPRNRCGVACLVEHTRPRLMLSGKMYRFRPHLDGLVPKYLAYLLQRHETQSDIDRMKTGMNDSGLNLTHDRFAALQVPLAPLREQHRIVAKIEELFSELDNAIESLMLARAQLRTYRQALLKAAFEGKLTAHWRAAARDHPPVINPPGAPNTPGARYLPFAADGAWCDRLCHARGCRYRAAYAGDRARGARQLTPLYGRIRAKSVVEAARLRSAEREHTWTKGQEHATRALVMSPNRNTGLQGIAGSAKTSTVIATFAEAARAQGLTIRAMAPTSAAAELLGRAVDAEDMTVARMLLADPGQAKQGREV